MKASDRRHSRKDPSRLWVPCCLIALGFILRTSEVRVGATEGQAASAGKVDYNRDVRPILARNCFACHGQDEAKRAKGLRLDRRDSAVKPLKNGDLAIVPGDPESSELIARITQEDDTMRMPPRKAGNRLTTAEVTVLRRWIEQGAEYATHWAFLAPQAKPIPRVADSSWTKSGIDFWILDRLEKEGLKPSPEASRPVLCAGSAWTCAAFLPHSKKSSDSSPINRATPTRELSTASSQTRALVSALPACGWTRPAMPTPQVLVQTRCARASGDTVTGS